MLGNIFQMEVITQYWMTYLQNLMLNLAHTGQIKERRTPVNVDGGLF